MQDCFVCFQGGAEVVCQCTAAAHIECLALLQEGGHRRCGICRCSFLRAAEIAAARCRVSKTSEADGPNSQRWLTRTFELALILAEDNQHDEAIALLLSVQDATPAGHLMGFACQVEIARSRVFMGSLRSAQDVLETVLGALVDKPGARASAISAEACLVQHSISTLTGDLITASRFLSRALSGLIICSDPEPSVVLKCLRTVARHHVRCKELTKASATYKMVVALSEKADENPVARAGVHIELAETQAGLGENRQAVQRTLQALRCLGERNRDPLAALLIPRARRLFASLAPPRRRMRQRCHPEDVERKMP